MRADARRNYERLLRAADAAFVDLGAEAPLEEIARRAGVGIGTLYRHFPTRQALLEAVFRDEFEAMRAEGERLLSSPSPGDAFARWLRVVLDHTAAYRGLSASVMSAMRDDKTELSTSMKGVHEAGAALLARAQRDGAVRSDLDSAAVFQLVCAIGVATEQAPDRAAQAEQLLSVVIDGMRHQAATAT
jgi:AcrR family transcriptional regulator